MVLGEFKEQSYCICKHAVKGHLLYKHCHCPNSSNHCSNFFLFDCTEQLCQLFLTTLTAVLNLPEFAQSSIKDNILIWSVHIIHGWTNLTRYSYSSIIRSDRSHSCQRQTVGQLLQLRRNDANSIFQHKHPVSEVFFALQWVAQSRN